MNEEIVKKGDLSSIAKGREFEIMNGMYV